MFLSKKSWKNAFDMILLINSIFWHHMPKIVDRPEISSAPLGFEKKRLKSVQERSLSKIVHVFIIFITKSELRFWPLPLKMDSTVTSMHIFYERRLWIEKSLIGRREKKSVESCQQLLKLKRAVLQYQFSILRKN